MNEDYIDFPVSSDWLDFYHERGLTPRSSGRLSRAERMFLERIEKLEEQMAKQQEILLVLLKELQKKSSSPRPQPTDWEKLKEE